LLTKANLLSSENGIAAAPWPTVMLPFMAPEEGLRIGRKKLICLLWLPLVFMI